jgi:hypothetical protein
LGDTVLNPYDQEEVVLNLVGYCNFFRISLAPAGISIVRQEEGKYPVEQTPGENVRLPFINGGIFKPRIIGNLGLEF